MKVNNYAIEINNLYSVYNAKKVNQFIALKNINYAFESGKIYFIIGKSGCGKSTLLSYFNGLSHPQFGRIKINEFDLDAKNNINNVVISQVEVDTNLLKKLFNKIDLNNKKIILLMCCRDANKNVVFINFNSKCNDHLYAIKKVNKSLLKKMQINNKTHKFYACLVDNDYLTNHCLIKPNQIKDEILKYNNKKLLASKKIKNYKELRRGVGVVYQFPEYQLFKSTIIDDVMFGPLNLGFNKLDAQNNAEDTLKELGIGEEYFERSPFGLSGGQKRKVALSGILAIQPKILVFDEPTSGLDPHSESEMMRIIQKAKEDGKTVFVVTHSMEQVLALADHVLVLDDGRIIKDGTPYDIFLDQEVINKTSIIVPKTISFINDLVRQNKKYEQLYQLQPKNANELVECLCKINKGKKHA